MSPAQVSKRASYQAAIRVAVKGDSPIGRAALEALLMSLPGLQVVPAAAALPPDVLLWEVGSGEGGIAPEHAAETAVLALIGQAVHLPLPAGVMGVFARDESPAALGLAIRQVSRGEEYLSPVLALALLRERQAAAGPPRLELKSLTPREYELLDLLAEGLSNKEIAARLYLSVRTVEGHLANLYGKLGIRSRTEAALIAVQRRA
jgi:DNA-binding CsgD family transcriptional regulator